MRMFLAGIMQGSHRGPVLHDQGYRQHLKTLLAEHFPDAEIYDPWADHTDSLDYDERRGREVFWKHNRLCREVDVVLAFVPEASMGTAIEMWEAHEHGRLVVTVSPLAHNWAIRFLSHVLYGNLEEFEQAVRGGELAARLRELLPRETSAG